MAAVSKVDKPASSGLDCNNTSGKLCPSDCPFYSLRSLFDIRMHVAAHVEGRWEIASLFVPGYLPTKSITLHVFMELIVYIELVRAVQLTLA